MPVKPELPELPPEVMEYLLDQKARELDLDVRLGELKQRLDKLNDQLKLLEHRDDDLTCTMAANNVYQVSSVKDVRDGITAQLQATQQDHQKVERQLLCLQQQIQRDHTALYVHLYGNQNVGNTPN